MPMADEILVDEFIDEDGNSRIVVESPKHTGKFVIRKTNDGFAFFEIKPTSGKTPQKLSGRFTRLDKALKAVKEYIRTAKYNTAKKYERNHGKTVRTGTDEHVREGANH